MIAVFDLDNCLADDLWRHGMIDNTKEVPFERFKDYASNSDLDAARNVEQVLNYKKQGDRIVILTSRSEHYRRITERWLAANNIPWDLLLMRPHGNTKPTTEYKVSVLLEHFIFPENVACAYDDRPDIVAAYTAAGFLAQRLFVHDIDYSVHG